MVEIDPSLCQNVSCMNPLYFFAVWDSMMAAVTKNSAEHENDNISITQKFGAKEEALRTPPPPPPRRPPPLPLKKNQIWILSQNSLTREIKIRVVGFVLKSY